MIRSDILTAYRKRKSIKATAREVGVSEGVVRKVLITAGILTTPLIERIRELTAAGMPEADVAELLGISASTVSANTPYSKGTYLDDDKSVNAIRIRECRRKQRQKEVD